MGSPLTTTRRSLHGVSELLLAGPQYRSSGTIRLQVTAGGFGQVTGPLRVHGAALVWGDDQVPLGGSIRDLAVWAGVEAGAPDGLYSDGADVDLDEALSVDPAEADVIHGWFALGDAALRTLGGGAEPVLWPEHFDLAVTVDQVNYGVSPGDASLPEPYAYVGPWERRDGEFWNAPFGAFRPATELPHADALADFFRAGQAAARL
ncbi:hypothetical protein PSU4_34100 [Pseudonocardia sulfidoxydans NBRC 16205]|uniref:Uncharacterized protein n=1 Tax=Pseudonocardia sulfidoxydans NBRC 16205 TaxID=1223511 RepID=A0A511DI25_9PSEU|nr:hypothetical protein [Pseudonocardia sulfidoxydans]GEL24456.1 hypothetical protein PSU4_34100 [Pseudonocardia sulfidoxydans NBRC 16205]